jgi:predicted nucleic acid-binding protein
VSKPTVVIDTNVLVAAGFNSQSSSARIVSRISMGDLLLVWNRGTRGESRAVLEQIPPLSWEPFADLFQEGGRYTGEIDTERVGYVSDPADRTFAALAKACDAALITNDDDLLANRDQADICIVTPDEFLERE